MFVLFVDFLLVFVCSLRFGGCYFSLMLGLLSYRFLQRAFNVFLPDFGVILEVFWESNSDILGVDFSWIFACRSKSGPRAAKSSPRAGQGGARAAQEQPKSGQEQPKSGPRAAQERPRAATSGQEQLRAAQERPSSGKKRPMSGKNDVTSRRHRPLGLYNIVLFLVLTRHQAQV